MSTPDAHARTGDDVARALEVDPDQGLSPAEAQQRLATHGANELAKGKPPTWLERILHEFRDPLVLLLLVAVVVSLVAWILEGGEGLPYDSIAISAILIVNGAIGAVQSHRADNAAAALERMAATSANVVRGGDIVRVDAREVVPGDVIVLRAGDAIPADARILSGTGMRSAEAALTGESLAVDKSPTPVDEDAALGDRTSMLFSGTSVVEGRGQAVVVATGMDTEVGHIAAMLGETERTITPLQREIQTLGRLLGALVVVIAILVMAVLLVSSDVESASDVIEILLVGVSLAVAAVPEGLPAVLSVVLAISVQRMAGRNALVKRLASAETLGAATVICTDKTGTLTRGEMTVRLVLVDDARVDVGGVGYEPTGQVSMAGAAPPVGVQAALETMLQSAVWASDAAVEEKDGAWVPVGSPTEAAIAAAARKVGGLAIEPAPERVGEIPFSSDRKRMSVLLADGRGAEGLLVTKGAPDVLIARCTSEAAEDGPIPLTDERRAWWQAEIDAIAASGLRTLAVASRRGVAGPLTEDDESGLEWLGAVGIDDPPREEAAPSVRAAHESGIRVVMITGDHRATASRIAAQLGIASPDGRAMTGEEIEALDDDQLADEIADVNVFARVTPAHKLRLVRAYQARQEVVAMTGDGVNDAPALKAADIGTAMGVAGTDVSREAADMILMDDNFATIVAAVSEGRTIWHNIRSFLRYLLSSNIGEVFTVFLGILVAGFIGLDDDGILAPLTASQILWINLLTDAGPALALGVDPVDPRVMREPPRARDERLLGGRMRNGILVIGASMALVTLFMFDIQRPGGFVEGSADVEYARTAAFTVLVFAQIFNSFSARSDTVSARHTWNANPLLLWAGLLAVALQVAVVHLPFLNDAFATAPLSAGDWLLSVALASVVLWVAEVRKWLIRR